MSGGWNSDPNHNPFGGSQTPSAGIGHPSNPSSGNWPNSNYSSPGTYSTTPPGFPSWTPPSTPPAVTSGQGPTLGQLVSSNNNLTTPTTAFNGGYTSNYNAHYTNNYYPNNGFFQSSPQLASVNPSPTSFNGSNNTTPSSAYPTPPNAHSGSTLPINQSTIGDWHWPPLSSNNFNSYNNTNPNISNPANNNNWTNPNNNWNPPSTPYIPYPNPNPTWTGTTTYHQASSSNISHSNFGSTTTTFVNPNYSFPTAPSSSNMGSKQGQGAMSNLDKTIASVAAGLVGQPSSVVAQQPSTTTANTTTTAVPTTTSKKGSKKRKKVAVVVQPATSTTSIPTTSGASVTATAPLNLQQTTAPIATLQPPPPPPKPAKRGRAVRTVPRFPLPPPSLPIYGTNPAFPFTRFPSVPPGISMMSAYANMSAQPTASTSVAMPPTLQPYRMNPEPDTPPEWESSCDAAVQALTPYHRILVPPKTEEYEVIQELVSSQVTVTKIERVVNTELWKKFITTRKELLCSKTSDLTLCKALGMTEKEIHQVAHISMNTDVDPTMPDYVDNIALLWHGTRGKLEEVFSQGLDERLGKGGPGGGGLLGRGIYFADDPAKSMGYDSHRVLLLFAVYLGDCMSVDGSNNHFVREPEKGKGEQRNPKDLFYDSIVGRPAGVNEFVVYNRFQCCPLYAVSYQHGSSGWGTSSLATLYQSTRTKLPPFAWNVKSNNGAAAGTPMDLWPFFANTIFGLMRKNEPIPPPQPLPPEVGSQEDEDIKMGRLLDMGFYDVEKNKGLLERFGYNLERTLDFLLNSFDGAASTTPTPGPSSSTATATGAPQVVDLTENWNSSQDSSGSQAESQSLLSPDYSVLPVPPIVTIDIDSSAESSLTTFGDDEDILSEEGESGPLTKSKAMGSASSATVVAPAPSPSPPMEEECTICFETYSIADTSLWRNLSCKHKVCVPCSTAIEKTGVTMSGVKTTFLKCPFCGDGCGEEIGTCPDGTMTVTSNPTSCQGFEGYPTHIIHYNVPGTKYALNRTAYLPATPEGDKVLGLLRRAWDRRLCFTIGTSVTTGVVDVLVWNIHHKTSMHGGVTSYGFPDQTYFLRVQEELNQYGIK